MGFGKSSIYLYKKKAISLCVQGDRLNSSRIDIIFRYYLLFLLRCILFKMLP